MQLCHAVLLLEHQTFGRGMDRPASCDTQIMQQKWNSTMDLWLEQRISELLDHSKNVF